MGFLDRFKPSPMTLAVSASPETVRPGDTVEAQLVVGGALDPLIEKIEFGFRGLNGFALSHSNDLGRAAERLHLEVREQAAALGTFDASFQVPADAAPTAISDTYATVDWPAFARAARAGRDVTDAYRVVVVGMPETCAAREHLPPLVRQNSDAAELTFDMPRRVQTGEELRGAVVVSARKALSVKQIELDLRYEEVTPHKPHESPDAAIGLGDERIGWEDVTRSGYSRVASATLGAEGTQLAAGEREALPFALPIPAEAPPCVATRRSRIHWTLRTRVDLDGEDGPQQELELNVYSAPPAG